jgi:DNA-binding MarR family transcriptional regulator
MYDTYSKLPSKVKYNRSICSNAKLLYGEIALLCQKNGFCYASNKFLGDLLNVTTRTITRLVKELKDQSLIRIDYSIDGLRKIYLID